MSNDSLRVILQIRFRVHRIACCSLSFSRSCVFDQLSITLLSVLFSPSIFTPLSPNTFPLQSPPFIPTTVFKKQSNPFKDAHNTLLPTKELPVVPNPEANWRNPQRNPL